MKKLTVILLLILHLFYPVCRSIGAVQGWEFILFSSWGFALLLTVLTIPVIFIAEPGGLTKVLMASMILDGIMIFECGGVLTEVCVYLWLLCVIILYFRSSASGYVRKLVLVLVFLLIAITVSSALDAWMDGMLEMSGSANSYDSPKGTYTVYAHTMNHGIAAGITSLSARDNSKAVNILVGKFYPPAENIGTVHINFFMGQDMDWLDEHTLQIGDQIFKMP